MRLQLQRGTTLTQRHQQAREKKQRWVTAKVQKEKGASRSSHVVMLLGGLEHTTMSIIQLISVIQTRTRGFKFCSY